MPACWPICHRFLDCAVIISVARTGECHHGFLVGDGDYWRDYLDPPVEFSTYTLASLVGVMSAVFAAIAYLSVNKLTKRHHNYEIVFYFCLSRR